MKKRHETLLKILNKQKFITIHELSSSLSVSPNTIRNDIKSLSQEGKLQKTHGGAVSIENTMPLFPSKRIDENSYRKYINIDKKQKIAGQVCSYIKNTENNTTLSIFMDGSTTCIQVAEELKKIIKQPIVIITNYPDLLQIFDDSPNISLILLGGAFWKNERYTIGPITHDMIKQFHVDIAILGITAINITENCINMYDMNQDIISIKKIMSECAKNTWIVCDSTKFDCKSLFYFCECCTRIKIFTDSKPKNYDILPVLLKKQIYY